MISNSKRKIAIADNSSSRTALRAVGLRVTDQRALLLDIVRRGGGHLDADEAYRIAREKEPRLSLSTVYRTLQTLKRLGLVEELHYDEAHHHYEAMPATEHHHLVCLGCGRVVEFHYSLADLVKKNVPEAGGFQIVTSEVRMTGYCPDCRRNRKVHK